MTDSIWYIVLACLSTLVIISFLFDTVARKTGIPSVLMLLLCGICARGVLDSYSIVIPQYSNVLPLLGILGLVLIVLEGALELIISKEKQKVITYALSSAVAALLASALLVASLFAFWLDVNFIVALVNTMPLAVISSAIAIPSVRNLSGHKRDFVVYESVFSDIIGILLFSILVEMALSGSIPFKETVGAVVITFAVTVFCVFLLVALLLKISDQVKLFLILSVLILVYALAKLLSLLPLLIIFIFGLLMANSEQIMDRFKILNWIPEAKLKAEFGLLKSITAESAFLVRTFFFALFGYSIDVVSFSETGALPLGLIITGLLIMVRFLYFRMFAQVDIFPEILVAPRGLVTILLYFSIPPALLIPDMTKDTLFVVVVATSLIMTIGLMIRRGEGKAGNLTQI